jgi:hypothetical protein
MTEARFTMTLADYNRETSTVSLRLAPVDIGVSLDAIEMDGKMDTLQSAINGVSLGLPVSQTRTYEREALASPNSAAASSDAQRERKWLVRCYDEVTFDPVTFEIPAADLSLLQTNSEYMDTSAGAGAALVTAIESAVVSKAGNPVIVVEIVHVGRNT